MYAAVAAVAEVRLAGRWPMADHLLTVHTPNKSPNSNSHFVPAAKVVLIGKVFLLLLLLDAVGGLSGCGSDFVRFFSLARYTTTPIIARLAW